MRRREQRAPRGGACLLACRPHGGAAHARMRTRTRMPTRLLGATGLRGVACGARARARVCLLSSNTSCQPPDCDGLSRGERAPGACSAAQPAGRVLGVSACLRACKAACAPVRGPRMRVHVAALAALARRAVMGRVPHALAPLPPPPLPLACRRPEAPVPCNHSSCVLKRAYVSPWSSTGPPRSIRERIAPAGAVWASWDPYKCTGAR